VVMGVRFRANFSIEDQVGQMVDHLLYSKKAFFDPKVFPIVSSGVGKKTLLNEKTHNSLQIDNSNIILEINFGGTFSAPDTTNLQQQFNSEVINGIMRTFKIKEIVRLGYVQRYVFKMEQLAKRFVDKTIGQTLGGINDINLSFSKRLPVTEALVKEGVNDYDNAIFNVIKKADLNEIFMSIDYQRYYVPFLESSSQMKFDEFVSQANSFTQKKYLVWLNSNYIEG
jgi:hypothetical protein